MSAAVVHPVRIAEEIWQGGRRRATDLSVHEIQAIAQTLVTMTQIVDDTAEVILDIEELGTAIASKTAMHSDVEAVHERLTAVRDKIEAAGILSAVASQRRPTDGEDEHEQGNHQGGECSGATG